MLNRKDNDTDSNSLPLIQSLLIVGDSLSDRGRMEVRKLLKIIPMSWLSGLSGVSPDGRYTNGHNWADFLALTLIDDHKVNVIETWAKRAFDISHTSDLDELKKKLHWESSTLKSKTRYYGKSYSDDDIFATKAKYSQFSKLFYNQHSKASARTDFADAIISHDKKIKPIMDNEVSLDNEELIYYKNKKFVRSFAEGGVTSHNFWGKWSWNLKHFFSRLILKSLKSLRELIFKDDKAANITDEDKANTLVIEWTGANDLATVNSRTTQKLARQAVRARVANVKAMIEKGYKHFVLFNLPDLSMTPRYQPGGAKEDEINFAYLASKAFNDELKIQLDALQEKHTDCMINIFDINAHLDKIFEDPKQYGFDPQKMRTPFLDDIKDPINAQGESPGKGYMFWDDVHSTADAQVQKAEELLRFLSTLYRVEPELIRKVPFPTSLAAASLLPPSPLEIKAKKYKADFVKAYGDKLEKDYYKFGGQFRHSEAPYLKTASLEVLLKHSMLSPTNRSHHVIEKLGWLESDGALKNEVSEAAQLRLR
jgi:hypothetical protein